MFEQIRKSLKGRASVLRWLQVAAVASLFIQGVWAQPGPGFNTTVPSQIMDQFRNQRILWTTNVWVYANTLFGILAVIEFAWSAAVMLLEKSDLQSWTSALIRKLMWIGAFYALLLNGRIVDSRDHRQLHADRPKRSRARRAIPERSLHPGPQHRRSAARRRKHIRVLHEPRHFVGAGVCGSADCCFLHAHHDQLHRHAGRELSRRVSRLHLSRLRW